MAKAKNKRRADGLYSVQITIGTNPSGSPKRKTFYGHTMKEAEAKRAAYEERLRKGTLAANEKATFEEVARAWLIYKQGQLGTSASSIKRFKRYASIVENQLAPLLPRQVKELKPADLDMILAAYAQQGKAKKTLKEFRQTARQIIDYAMENDIVFRNVFAKVKLPAAPEQEREALTDEQRALVTAHWEGHRAGVGALIMLYCGLRRGELIPLTWKDIDLDKKTITVNKSASTASNTFTVKPGAKTEAGCRVVDIPDCILPALTRAKAAAGGFLVMPGADGAMLSGTGYTRLWESYMHYLNLCAGGRDKVRTKNENGKAAFTPAIRAMEPFTAHQLRHTYATMLYDAGVDPKSAQRLMGHASLEMTLKIYTHLSQRKKADSIGKLNAYLGDQDGGLKNEAVKMQ